MKGDIKRVAIIGVGNMGYGIGLEFARFGYPVALYDISKNSLQRATEQTHEDLELMLENKLLTAPEARATYKRLQFKNDIAEAASGADYVVEAVKESLPLKQEIFAKLDEICPPPAILATNTSGLLVSDIAARARHRGRILATHYFFPPHFVPLVEVGRGKETDPEAVERTAKILRSIRKKAVVIEVEILKFIGNRFQGVLNEEIHSLIDQGVCTPEMVDDVIVFGFGRRLPYAGVFKRLDMIGLDFEYSARKGQGVEPWKVLADHYNKGELGMKTGKGFYEWPADSAKKFEKRFKTELIRLMKYDMETGEI